MQHRHLSAGRCRDAGKLQRDVAAADEQHALRQYCEVEEVVTDGEVLLPGNPQGLGLGAGGDYDVAALHLLITHPEHRGTYKPRVSVEAGNTGLLEARPPRRRPRPGEAVLEPDQRRPVNPHSPRLDPPAHHPPRPVHRIGRADEHLLGITAPQGARTPIRVIVHQRHLPTGFAASRRNRRASDAGADDDKIELLCHTALPPGTFAKPPCPRKPESTPSPTFGEGAGG